MSKLQHYSLAFVAGLKRATDEGSLPEIAQYTPYYLPLNALLLPKDKIIIFLPITYGKNISFVQNMFRKNKSDPLALLSCIYTCITRGFHHTVTFIKCWGFFFYRKCNIYSIQTTQILSETYEFFRNPLSEPMHIATEKSYASQILRNLCILLLVSR